MNLSRARWSIATDAAVWAVVLRLPHLRRLRLSPTDRMCESGLCRVMTFVSLMNSASSSLERQRIAEAAATSSIFPIPTTLLESIVQRGVLSSLVHLELNMAPSARLSGLTSLRTLIIEPPVPVAFNTYKSIRRTPMEIDQLSLPSSLTELKLMDCVIRRHDFFHTIHQQVPGLKSLDLTDSNVAHQDTQLAVFTQLQTLVLNYATSDSRWSLSLPSSLQNLQAISVYSSRPTLIDFSNCSRLKQLNLSFRIEMWYMFFGHQDVRHLPKLNWAHLQELEELKLCNCNLRDDQLHLITASLPNLRALYVNYNKKVTPSCVSNLRLVFPKLSIAFSQPKVVDLSFPDESVHNETATFEPCAQCGARIQTCCAFDHSLVCRAQVRDCFFASAGCTARFDAQGLRNHIAVCSFNLVICPRCQEVIPRSEFEMHSLLHDKTALLLKNRCPLAEFGCLATWPQNANHMTECHHWNVSCPSCRETFASRRALTHHTCSVTSERVRLPERSAADISRFGRSKYSYYSDSFVEDGE